MQLLTIAAMAKRLGIPDATVRYYRDQFEPWVPAAIGEGRDRRYTDESVEVLRFIADAMKASIPAESIRMRLAERFPTTQDAQPPATTTAQPTPAAVIDALGIVIRELLDEQRDATIRALSQENSALRSEVAELRSSIAEVLDLVRTRLPEPQDPPPPPPPWWRRWWQWMIGEGEP